MTTQYRKGDRVQMHPATDAWMQGDRFGTVLKDVDHSATTVKVKLDRSGYHKTFRIEDVLPIGQPTDEQLAKQHNDYVEDMEDQS